MDPERKSDSHPSEMPVTERKVAVRLPAEWLDRLLVAVCEIEPGQELEDGIGAILDTALSLVPQAAFGVRAPDGRATSSRTSLTVRRTSHLVAAHPPADGALFPELAEERHFPIDFEPDGLLAVASNDPTVLAEGGPGAMLVSRLALAVGTALRTMRQHARARARVSEADDLRRSVVQNDKLAGLGKVVAGVVHELNNPVTSILAYADYLRRKAERGAIDASDVERLIRIQEAAQRIHGFSRDLVAYSRPSTEVPVPLNVHDVIDRALVFCEHVLDRTHVTVERTFGEVKPVRGLGGQLAQVFVNLFTNAANAMSETGGTLHIQTTLAEQDRSVKITVSDTGQGIGDDTLPRIFEPFFTTSADGEGTGLGLSIVRSIVESHRGSVWADRTEGAGAAFHVMLPVAPDEDD